eukprot:6180729-Pleurochrysis_carterae.AAC.1
MNSEKKSLRRRGGGWRRWRGAEDGEDGERVSQEIGKGEGETKRWERVCEAFRLADCRESRCAAHAAGECRSTSCRLCLSAQVEYSGTPVAIKRFFDSGVSASAFEREVALLAELRHPNVVQLMKVSSTRTTALTQNARPRLRPLRRMQKRPSLRNMLVLRNMLARLLRNEAWASLAARTPRALRLALRGVWWPPLAPTSSPKYTAPCVC